MMIFRDWSICYIDNFIKLMPYWTFPSKNKTTCNC